MRNLVLLKHDSVSVSEALAEDVKIEATAHNLEDGTIYAAATCQSTSPSGDVKIVFLQKREGEQSFTRFSSLIVPAAPPALPGSSCEVPIFAVEPSVIVSFHYLSDGGQEALNQPALCAVTSGGDILLLSLHEENDATSSGPQIVGSIEQGILAACWSPDDELLVVITNETSQNMSASGSREIEKVLLMTRDFEVLSEKQLRTDEFGEDAAVDVGWGSKATQFHGSEGKAAAAAAAAIAAVAKESKSDTRGPCVPDDDGRPRISWRGDGAFFVISSLEPYQSKFTSENETTTWHRIIRIFARLGALSATSDAAVRGISHTLAFRPVGNMIATTQRFGASETGSVWAQGRKGRHDVAFFERNGLRHGEFSLREESASQPDGKRIAWSDSQKELSWSRAHRVRELAWNADGSSLAIWLSRLGSDSTAEIDVVQIFTTGNYHWYLKQEFVSSVSAGKLSQVKWHAEDPWQCSLVYDNRVEHLKLCLETASSGGRPPHDVACVTVADGSASLLTPFRLQNVPPPMSSSALLHPPATQSPMSDMASISVPVHCSWSQMGSVSEGQLSGLMALSFSNGITQVWRFDWGILGGKHELGGSPVPDPTLIATMQTSDGDESSVSYQVALAGWAKSSLQESVDAKITLAVLSSGQQVSKIRMVELTQSKDQQDFALTLQTSMRIEDSSSLRLVSGPFVPTATEAPIIYIQTGDGTVHAIQDNTLQPIAHFERFCPELRILARPNSLPARVIGLATNGRLYANEQMVAKDATSFTLAGSFLIWTNSAHQVQFLPVVSLTFTAASSALAIASADFVDLGRRVERGSRIVTPVTSLMALVLQMPRGNLETICPRPLVLEVVRRDVDNRRYGAAFRICRTHRMDVNILYDHDPDSFMANVSTFVQQVSDVDHINLFLSGLRNEDVTTTIYKPASAPTKTSSLPVSGKVNRICDAMRAELEKLDAQRYINSILTTYVRKVPADYEAGLSLLLELREKNQDLAEEAVKYIIFLADADKLFDVALGMYDFALTLMVAQHAQRKDPREYLPFLRELRSLSPPEYQRFRIDDHLKRHSKALSWLSKTGSAHHEEALQYIQKHKLFHEAVDLYRSLASSALRDVYGVFGSYLMSRRKYDDAGALFQLAHQNRNAIDAYKQSRNWREMLRLALAERMAASEVVVMAKEMIDELESTKDYTEASRIALDYLKDVEQGVTLLCKDNSFSEAGRVLQTHTRIDLLSTTFNPLLTEAATWVLEESAEITEQLGKQMARIAELREKKEQQPDGFYGEDDPALDNIDVMSDTSTQMTQFTRYTTAASVATQSSLATFSTKSGSKKKEAKLKKKQERQKAGGKKGSVYEEDYLYTSIAKLLNERLSALQGETGKILTHLAIAASIALRGKAKEVHDAIEGLEKRAQEAVDKLWSYSQEDDDQRFRALVQFEADILSGSIASNPSLGAMMFRSCVNRPVPRLKISIAETNWRIVLLDQSSASDQ